MSRNLDPKHNINLVPLLTAYMKKPGPMRLRAALHNGYMPGEAAPWSPAGTKIPAGLDRHGNPLESTDIRDYIPKIRADRVGVAETGVVCE